MGADTLKSPLLVGAAVVAAFVVVAALIRRYLGRSDIHPVRHTMFGPAVIYNVEGDDGTPVRVLNVALSIQSATYLDERYCEPVFAYIRLYDLAFETGMPVHNVCMLGGGGYAYPKHLIATRPDARIDVVEVDRTITSLAQRYFFLDRLVAEYDLEDEETGAMPRLGLVESDALAYLEAYAHDATRPRYDAVMNDCFSASEPLRSLASVDAARTIHACLLPGGVYLTNVVGALEGAGSDFLLALAQTLRAVFTHVYAVPCGVPGAGERDNVMLVACDRACDFGQGIEIEPSRPNVEETEL